MAVSRRIHQCNPEDKIEVQHQVRNREPQLLPSGLTESSEPKNMIRRQEPTNYLTRQAYDPIQLAKGYTLSVADL